MNAELPQTAGHLLEEANFYERTLAITAQLRINLGRIAGVTLLAAGSTLGIAAAESIIPTPAMAAMTTTPKAVIGMPFTGKWAYNTNVNPPYSDANSSHPSVHNSYGFDWATDVYANSGTDVKATGSSPQGAVTFKRVSTSDTCASYGANIAGHGETLDVLVNDEKVGQVAYDHLDLTDIGANAVASGTKIGTVTKESLNASCYQVRHVHVQFQNTEGNYSCYVDQGNAGTSLNESDNLGVLGSANSGPKQACTGIPDGSNNRAPTRPSNPPYVSWNFETMEGDRSAMSPHNGNTGQAPTSIDFNGQLYAFSYDKDNGDLRYAKTVPGWHFDVLDGEGGDSSRENANVGQTPAAVVYNNSLQLFYYDSDGGNLRHAWSADGANWNFETLDGASNTPGGQEAVSGQTPVAVVHNGTLQLFYYNSSGGDLRHGWADTSGWHFETLEGDPHSISGYDSNVGLDPTTVSQNDMLQVFYYDTSQNNLRHAWADGAGWHFENLDGDLHSICGRDGVVGKNPSAVEYQNTLQVFYYDQTGGDLRHAWSDSTGWHCETLEGDRHSLLGFDGDVGAMPTAAVVGDSLQVFAEEPQWGTLRHYWNNTSGWHSENFDGLGGSPGGRVNHAVGADPSVTVYGGRTQLFYYDQTEGNLRHATPNQAS